MLVCRTITFESALFILQSALRDFASLTYLDNSPGTRHRCDPLRYAMLKRSHVLDRKSCLKSEILEVVVNICCRAKMRSTSDLTSFTPTACGHKRRRTIEEPFPASRLHLSQKISGETKLPFILLRKIDGATLILWLETAPYL